MTANPPVDKNNIRLMTEDDARYFADIMLHDPEALKFLNITGADFMVKKFSDSYKLCLTVPKKAYIIVNSYPQDGTAHISQLYVTPPNRRQGIAILLVEFIQQLVPVVWPEVKKIHSITLEGASSEKYKERTGFKRLGVYKKYTRDLDQSLWEYEVES